MADSLDIKKEVADFLERYSFARLYWGGEELTVYTDRDEPMGISEFKPGSETRKALAALQERLSTHFGTSPFSSNAVSAACR